MENNNLEKSNNSIKGGFLGSESTNSLSEETYDVYDVVEKIKPKVLEFVNCEEDEEEKPYVPKITVAWVNRHENYGEGTDNLYWD
jgi:hypothetical protein